MVGLVGLGLTAVFALAALIVYTIIFASVYPWVGLPLFILILILALGWAFEDGFYK